VDEYDAYAHLVQDAYLFHKRARACNVCEHLAADLQHKNLPLEKAYVWRRVFQCGYNGGPIVSLLHDCDPSIRCRTAI
jgi:hypothetical protein